MLRRRRSYEELEFIAEHFLAGLDRRCFKGDEVLIDNVVEECGYTIWPQQGLARLTPGFLPIEGNKIFIAAEVMDHQPHEFRLTLAEEQAHQLIHAPYFRGWSPENVEAYVRSVPPKEYRRIEQEARYLGNCLLMPEQVFSDRVRWFTKHVTDQEGDRHSESAIVHTLLANFFNVPVETTAKRCFELRRLRFLRRLEGGSQLHLPLFQVPDNSFRRPKTICPPGVGAPGGQKSTDAAMGLGGTCELRRDPPEVIAEGIREMARRQASLQQDI